MIVVFMFRVCFLFLMQYQHVCTTQQTFLFDNLCDYTKTIKIGKTHKSYFSMFSTYRVRKESPLIFQTSGSEVLEIILFLEATSSMMVVPISILSVPIHVHAYVLSIPYEVRYSCHSTVGSTAGSTLPDCASWVST